MENDKTLLTKIRDFVLGLEEEKETVLEIEEVKLEDMQLENGTVISAVAFEPGEAVYIVNPDSGEQVPLPVGDYQLADGQLLVVAEEGIISEIKQPEAAPEEEMATEFVTKSDFDAAINEIKSMLSKVEEKNTQLSKEKEEMQKQIESIPESKKINHAPVEMKVAEPKNRKERIYNLMKNQN